MKKALALVSAVVLIATLVLKFAANPKDENTSSAPSAGPVASASASNEKSGDVDEIKELTENPEFSAVEREIDGMFNPPSSDWYAISNFGAQFSGWLQQMNAGDLKAAKAIWRANHVCSQRGTAPFSELSYQEMRSEEIQRAKLKSEEPSKRVLMGLASGYMKCGNVTDGQRQAALRALKMLADSGDWQARKDFIFHARPDVSNHSLNTGNQLLYEHKRTAIKYLNEEIAKGSVDALEIASSLYGKKDYAAPSGIYNADPVKELAYRLAAIAANQIKLKNSPSLDPLSRAQLQSEIERAERDTATISTISGSGNTSLSEEQIRQASEMSQEILNRCCKG